MKGKEALKKMTDKIQKCPFQSFRTVISGSNDNGYIAVEFEWLHTLTQTHPHLHKVAWMNGESIQMIKRFR